MSSLVLRRRKQEGDMEERDRMNHMVEADSLDMVVG